jgi:transcription initiation factor TFIID subunit 8
MPVIQTLYERAHEYANLASRETPVANDVLIACNERGLKGRDLHNIAIASESTGQYELEKIAMY